MNPFLNIATSGKVNFDELKEGSAGSGLLGGLLSGDGLQGVVDHESMGGETGNFEQYLDNSTDESGSKGPSKVWSTTLSESEEADIAPIVTPVVQSSSRVLPQIVSTMVHDSEQGDALAAEMPEETVRVESGDLSNYQETSYMSHESEESSRKSEDVRMQQLLKEPVFPAKITDNEELKEVLVQKEPAFTPLTRPIPLAPKGDFRADEPFAQTSKENVVFDREVLIEPPEDSKQAEEVWSTTYRSSHKDIEESDNQLLKDSESAEVAKPLIRPILEPKEARPAAKPISAPTVQGKIEIERKGSAKLVHESPRSGTMRPVVPSEFSNEGQPSETVQYAGSSESRPIEVKDENASLTQYSHERPRAVSMEKPVEQEGYHAPLGQGESTSFQKVVHSEPSHEYQPLTETAERSEAGFVKPVPQKEVLGGVSEKAQIPSSEVKLVEAKVQEPVKEGAPSVERVVPVPVALQESEGAHQEVAPEKPLPMPEATSPQISISGETKNASISSIMSNIGTSLIHEVDQESLTTPHQVQPIVDSSQSVPVDNARPVDALLTYVPEQAETAVPQQAMSQVEQALLVSESARLQEPVRAEDPALLERPIGEKPRPVAAPVPTLNAESLLSDEGSLTELPDTVATKEPSRVPLSPLNQAVDQEGELATEIKDLPLNTIMGSRSLGNASEATASKAQQKSEVLQNDVASDYRVSMDRMAAEEEDVVDELDLSKQQKLERLVAPYTQHKPERETRVQGRSKQVSASMPLTAPVSTESSASMEDSLRYEIPESGIQVSPDRSLSKKDIGMQELFRDLVQGMQNRDEASLNPELGKPADVRALHSHSEKAETPFEPIPAMQNLNPKLMQQLEQFQRSQRPWAKLSLPMEEGEELMLSFKILDGRIQVRFGTQNSGLRETIERGWSDLIKMASMQGIALDQPEFEGRLRMRGQVFQSAQRSDLNEDGNSKNAKRRLARIDAEGESSASDALDDYEGMLKWA